MKSVIQCILFIFSMNLYALDKVNHLENVSHDCVIKSNKKCDGNATCKDMVKQIANTPNGDRLYKFSYKILSVKSEKVYEGISPVLGGENDGKQVITYKCDIKYEIDKVIPFSSKTQKCEEVTEEYVICNERQYVFQKSIFDDLKRNVKKMEDHLDTTTKPISVDTVPK